MVSVEIRDFEQWRTAARPLLTAGTAPGEIDWSDGREPSLLSSGAVVANGTIAATGTVAAASTAGHGAAPANSAPPIAPVIPARLLRLLQDLACYRDPARWQLMYHLTWRVIHENRDLLDNDADPQVSVARKWQKAIHHDIHKMHAFVRFHETEAADGCESYVAWFEPQHEILRATAPFFEKRFPNMRWMIATPDGAAVWTGEQTQFIESPRRADLPRDDSTHSLWRAYYRNICNVARINPTVMQRDMPQRYWRHLPEASEINSLIKDGKAATHRALHDPATPDDLRIPQAIARSLQEQAPPADSPLTCRRCTLWRQATQAVPGEGPANAAIMLVGEQPGDEEDLRGKPFVGPAGQVLDQALIAAGLSRSEIFVTNAVKHFKWEPRGKRRLHKRPDQQEVLACSMWLEREIGRISPKVIVALGATAIRAVTGSSPKVEAAREHIVRHGTGAAVICTYHPSAILRSEGERKSHLVEALRTDLRRAMSLVS